LMMIAAETVTTTTARTNGVTRRQKTLASKLRGVTSEFNILATVSGI